MWFEVCPLRQEGVVLPLWQRNHAAARGELVVAFEDDDDLHRPIKVARLLRSGDGSTTASLPPLYDVELVTCRRDLWTMTGYERGTDARGRPARYQQSWLLIPVDIVDGAKARGDPPPGQPHSENGILARLRGEDIARGASSLPAPTKDQPPQMTADLVVQDIGAVRIEYRLSKSSHGRSATRWFWTACKATVVGPSVRGAQA